MPDFWTTSNLLLLDGGLCAILERPSLSLEDRGRLNINTTHCEQEEHDGQEEDSWCRWR